jgi:hypothetical protein
MALTNLQETGAAALVAAIRVFQSSNIGGL